MKKFLATLTAAAILAPLPVVAVNPKVDILLNLNQPLPLAPGPTSSTATSQQTTGGPTLEPGVPYDLLSYNNRYYALQTGEWFTSIRSDGPWQPIKLRDLPVQVRLEYQSVRNKKSVVYEQ
jgi:hypothetical protein